MSWWHSSKAPHSKLLSNALKRWRDRQSFPVAVLWLFEFNLSYPDFAWITSHFESNISDKNIILTHRWFNPELKSISFCRFVQVVQFPPTFRNNSGGWARLCGSKDIPSTTIKSFRNTVLTTNKHEDWVKVSSLWSHTNTVGKKRPMMNTTGQHTNTHMRRAFPCHSNRGIRNKRIHTPCSSQGCYSDPNILSSYRSFQEKKWI